MKAKRLTGNIIYHACILGLGYLMIYPVLWMIFGSLKTNQEILQNTYQLLPTQWLWENYSTGWSGFGGTTFATFFKNSIVISTIATIGTVLSCTLIAYALARINFKGRKVWFNIMIMTMLLPGQVIMIPQYLIYRRLGWVGTILPLTLIKFFGQPFFIYMMMQFVKGLPRDLDEAAAIDGCSKYSTFSRIILPLLGPSIITTIVIQFYWVWDDFMGPLLYLNRPTSYTVSYAIKLFADATSTTAYGPMFAMSTLSLIPVFTIFLIFNRYLMDGVTAGSIKG
ncbi:MAG: carbohydrate ABC transporter permease [Lachnospiraceae bacterium]|nr:carbohydrate ABC transporter permease [Lachnospiraceae bacterium]